MSEHIPLEQPAPVYRDVLVVLMMAAAGVLAMVGTRLPVIARLWVSSSVGKRQLGPYWHVTRLQKVFGKCDMLTDEQ